jgi:hypothetical protein
MDAMAVTGDGVWAVSDGRFLWFMDGDGQVVAELTDATANCIAASADLVLVGASDARLFRLAGPELIEVESFADAPGRDTWGTPWGGPPDVRSVAIGPDGVVYVNVHVGGVLRSVDLEGWEPTMDVAADVHQVTADPDRPRTAYAAAAIGLGVTTDGGDSWTFRTDGLHARYCRAVAVSGDLVLLSASAGPGGQQAAVYRVTANLERCRHGLPEWFDDNVDSFCIAAAGDRAAIAAPDGTVFESTDGGRSWETVATGLPGPRCVAYAGS